MLKNYVRPMPREDVWYELVFDDGYGNGFGFPCYKDGKVFESLTKEALTNLTYCLSNPSKFERFNEVVRFTDTYLEPAHGTCRCGNEVELFDQYYGACQCEKCGSWYNLFGQELVPPEHWETDPSEEQYY